MSSPYPAETIDIPSTPDDRQWVVFAHLGGLIAGALSLGSGGFLVPLVIWLIKREQSRFLDDQAKEALNFQLSLLLVTVASTAVGGILAAVTFGLAFLLLIPVGIAIVVYGVVMPIIAAVKSNAGEVYRYPITIRFVK